MAPTEITIAGADSRCASRGRKGLDLSVRFVPRLLSRDGLVFEGFCLCLAKKISETPALGMWKICFPESLVH